MSNKRFFLLTGVIGVLLLLSVSACKTPALLQKQVATNLPAGFTSSQDTVNTADVNWRMYFKDPQLVALIDTAIANNQELNIMRQEIEIASNEVRIRKGEYLPFLNLGTGAGVDKAARYTSRGASEAVSQIEPGKAIPEPLPDFMLGAYATWEIDIWHKLRNAKKAAFNRYLSSVEGKNFLVTNLITEIANSYYELLSLDNQLDIVTNNIEIRKNAFELMKVQKEAARVTELAVKRFEAQLLHTQSLQFEIRQRIIETENRINFLTGRYPQHVQRNSAGLVDLVPDTVYAGIPAQLIQNRPDIRQAELELTAAKLDLKVARASFYPSLRISAGMGIQAYNPALLFKAPESILYSMLGDAFAPLINRNALKANYSNANAKQNQAVYNYERRVLNAYIEVANQLAKLDNLKNSYDLKKREVQALTESVEISGNLFASARADYMEVLMTQRDVLESRFDLIETKKQQMNAVVDIYRALGGGWN